MTIAASHATEGQGGKNHDQERLRFWEEGNHMEFDVQRGAFMAAISCIREALDA